MHPVVCPAVAGGTFKLEGFVFKSVGIAGTGDALGQQGAFGSGAGLSCAAGNDCAVYRFGAPDGAAAAVSLIPGIGQGAAAVSQVLLGSSVLIRNTVGIGGVLVLAAVSLLPLLKLLILYLGCQGSAALLQPVSDSRVVEAVGAVAKGFYFLLAAAGSAVVLFALSIAVVCVSTNAAYFAG